MLRNLLFHTKITDVYTTVFPQYVTHIKKELANCNSILDIGCGSGSSASPFRSGTYSVGVELYLPSLMKSKKRKIYNDLVHGDINRIEFKSKSFDCVLCSDVIEHVTKKDGIELIKKMEDFAIKKILILTPNGYNPKEQFEDANILQAHRSGWTINEFVDMDYEVKGELGLKYLRGEREQLRFKPWFLWQTISDLTQIVTFSYPRYAYHILCVKRLK
ncbi:MAG: class I SAM-dependent methyltransferase [Candidatus Bathyarchaeia archaeon]